LHLNGKNKGIYEIDVPHHWGGDAKEIFYGYDSGPIGHQNSRDSGMAPLLEFRRFAFKDQVFFFNNSL